MLKDSFNPILDVKDKLNIKNRNLTAFITKKDEEKSPKTILKSH